MTSRNQWLQIDIILVIDSNIHLAQDKQRRHLAIERPVDGEPSQSAAGNTSLEKSKVGGALHTSFEFNPSAPKLV